MPGRGADGDRDTDAPPLLDDSGEAVRDGACRLGRIAQVPGPDEPVESIMKSFGGASWLAPADDETVAVIAEAHQFGGRGACPFAEVRGKGQMMTQIDCRAAHEQRR